MGNLMDSRRRIVLNEPHLETMSGSMVAYDKGERARLVHCEVTFQPTQSGSGIPSPDNIRTITGWDSIPLLISHDGTGTTVNYSLDTTRYGGVVDLVTGVLTVTHIYKQITSNIFSAFYGHSSSVSDRACSTKASMSEVVTGSSNPQGVLIASNMECKYNGAAGEVKAITVPFAAMSGTAGNTSLFVCFPDSYGVTSLDLAKTWIDEHPFGVYCKLATPQTYQLTPQTILTLQGSNYISSAAGPISIGCYVHYPNNQLM